MNNTIKHSSRVARYAAYAVDIFILIIAQFIVVALISIFFPSSDISITKFVDDFFGLIVSNLYFWILTYFYGKTLGKQFFGLEVIDIKTNSKPSLGKAFLREVVGKFIAGISLGLGFAWILWDKKRQGWHDKMANSLVVEVKPLAGAKKIIAYIIVVVVPILTLLGIFNLIYQITLSQ